jgi:hypothetical protein
MEVLIAERVMQHYFPHHYAYWETMLERTAVADADTYDCILASVFTTSFCPIAPYGFKSKYYRNMCLALAAEAFPASFALVFEVMPDRLGKPRPNVRKNPAIVKLLELKIHIKIEKEEVKRLTAEHKATLKQLKIKKQQSLRKQKHKKTTENQNNRRHYLKKQHFGHYTYFQSF